jgi:hypothetical protein
MLNLLLAIAILQGQPAQMGLSVTLITPKDLGSLGWQTFKNPDSVVVQGVYPGNLLESPDYKLGKSEVVFSSTPRTVEPETVRHMQSDLLRKVQYHPGNCGFHPDHLVRFVKGDNRVELLTCYGCMLVTVYVNGKWTGKTGSLNTYFYLKQAIAQSFTPDDAIRKLAMEKFTRAGFKTFESCETATVQQITTDRINSVTDSKSLGPETKLSTLQTTRFVERLLAHFRSGKMQTGQLRKPLPNQYSMITFVGNPTLSLTIRWRAG